MDYDLAEGPRNRVHVHTNSGAELSQRHWLKLDQAVDLNTILRRQKAELKIGYGTRDDDSTDLDRDTTVE